MPNTPRKTYPELTAQTTVVDTDLLATYRTPGPLKKLTVAVLRAFVQRPRTQSVSSTSITLSSSYFGYTTFLTASTAVTITVPAGLDPEFEAAFVQWGTGTVTFVPSSTTINQTDGLFSTVGQYATASLIGKQQDQFVLAGQLA